LSSILIFDSGVGGLSILKHIKAKLPDTQVDYLADHAAYPYGEKKEDWLINRCQTLLSIMQNKQQYQAIIIACNTASTLVLPSLRANTSTPIIGVVPAIKTASELSSNKRIGLLATPGTVSRQYMNELINEFAQSCQTTRVGSTNMVYLAEGKLHGKTVDTEQLASITKPFIDAQCDYVVLGCTHFPLLKDELQLISSQINWIDSGEAIANRASYILKQSRLADTHKTLCQRFFSTAEISNDLKPQLINMGFQQFETIELQ
jgi:glutamate racemase